MTPLTSKIHTLKEMLPSGIDLALPQFQREYTWKRRQCQELWADIQAVNQSHYMGAVTLQDKSIGNNHKYQIIDGQQRLVSLSLMALACARHMEWVKCATSQEKQRNLSNAKKIRSEFLVNGDDPTAADKLKIKLPGGGQITDATYYRRLFRGELPQADSVTQENMRAAFLFFEGNFRELGDGVSCFNFMSDRAGERLLFTRIVIPRQYDAPRVFASLNARGLPLTSANLVKCHLMVTAPSAQTVQCADHWSAMNDEVGEGAMAKFLCHAYNAKHPPATDSNLPDKVKELVNQESDVIPYLEDLRKKCDLFCALQNPNEEQWPLPEDFRCVRFFKAYGVTAIYPALMSAKECIPSELSRILGIYEVVMFRRSVAELVARPIKNASEEFARKIAAGEICSEDDLRQKFMSDPTLYPIDATFRPTIDGKAFTWPTGKPAPDRLRYVLARLEAHMSNDATEGDIKVKECVQILSATDLERRGDPVMLAKSLGNFALWEHEGDDPFANKSISERIEALRGSCYHLSNSIASAPEFNLVDMKARHKQLVDCAVKTWRLDPSGH